MKTTIDKCLTKIALDDLHRYTSWEHCYQAFSVQKPTENYALQLAFYLASWGMYRGSSGLLQKNHLVHQGAVDILFSEKYQRLKCNRDQEVTSGQINDILALKKELSGYYSKIHFINGKGESRPISATDTLISKILLGTLSCVPAYDRYFKRGLKEGGLNCFSFNSKSLNVFFDFIKKNEEEIKKCQNHIQEKRKIYYPVMKILDMYFWKIGYK